jgi:hypothetical protein
MRIRRHCRIIYEVTLRRWSIVSLGIGDITPGVRIIPGHNMAEGI